MFWSAGMLIVGAVLIIVPAVILAGVWQLALSLLPLSSSAGAADGDYVTQDGGHRRLVEGLEMHRGGRAADAEVAYRDAIAAGLAGAWLYLGLLLQPRQGREQEAKAAFRAAMADADVATSSRAAVELADMLRKLDGDVAGARECYEFAAKHGSEWVWETATINRAYMLAAEGDRDGARAAFQAVAARRLRQAGFEVTDGTGLRFAAALASLAARRRSRRLLRRVGVTAYRARRLRRRRFPSGLRARLNPRKRALRVS